MGEVDAGGVAEQLHDLGEVRLVVRLPGSGRRHRVRVPADAGDLPGDPVRGQHEVHAAGGDGAVRHALVLGRVVLGEGDAALGLDLFQPEGAVGGGAGQDHADGPVPLVLRQRAEELIDRPVRRRGPRAAGAATPRRTMIMFRSGGIT